MKPRHVRIWRGVPLVWSPTCDLCGATPALTDQLFCAPCLAYLQSPDRDFMESRRGNDNGWGDGGWES